MGLHAKKYRPQTPYIRHLSSAIEVIPISRHLNFPRQPQLPFNNFDAQVTMHE